jgi:hypothetical protein
VFPSLAVSVIDLELHDHRVVVVEQLQFGVIAAEQVFPDVALAAPADGVAAVGVGGIRAGQWGKSKMALKCLPTYGLIHGKALSAH